MEHSGLGIHGNFLLARLPADDPNMVHYSATANDDYSHVKFQKSLRRLTFTLTDHQGRLVHLRGKALSLLITFSLD